MTTPAVQIAHIQSCACIPELRAYWNGLKVNQPEMASNADVMAAKERHRLRLIQERKDEVARISRAA